MLDVNCRDSVLRYLSSRNPFDNGEALVAICDRGVFDDEYADLAEATAEKDEAVAFRVPVCVSALTYLHLCGRRVYEGDEPHIS